MPATSLIDVNDILLYIVSNIAVDFDAGMVDLAGIESSIEPKKVDIARRTLARLAQVHTRFNQPALAALWKFLPSDEPLKHLLCLVGIAQRPPHHEDVWRKPSPVRGSRALRSTATLTCFAGTLCDTHNPCVELGAISRICHPRASNHHRPFCSGFQVPIETSTGHLLVSGVVCLRRTTYPSSLRSGDSLQPNALRIVRLRYGRIAVSQPILTRTQRHFSWSGPEGAI